MPLRRARNEKKQPEIKTPAAERIVDALDLPKEIVLGLPRLIFTGDRELFVENYRGIVEYGDGVIRLSTSTGMLKVMGKGLNIKHIATEEITLCGQIKGVEFIS